MRQLYDVLNVVELVVFCALGVLAFVQWRRRGGEAGAWLAATFGVLAVVSVAGQVFPDHPASAALEWARRAELGVIALFPYFLYRFTRTFDIPYRRWIWVVGHVLTGAVVAGAFVLPRVPTAGQARPWWFDAYIYLLLTQWIFLTTVVAFRLWRGGRGQPTIARRRMRTLSLGAVGLAFALVLAGSAPSTTGVTALQVAIQVIAIVAAVLFVLGFAPPGLVRQSWRRGEEETFRATERALMEAITPADIARVLLPHVALLVGGGGSFMVDGGGKVIGSYGLAPEEQQELVAAVAERPATSTALRTRLGTALTVPLRGGWLMVTASPFSPFFGREEVDMLRDLALLAELALGRAELYRRERRAQEQLIEAQRIASIGSWEWDFRTNTVSWSDQLYEIFDFDKETVPSVDAFMTRVHPDDRAELDAATAVSREEHESFESEYRIVRRDGTVATIHAQGKAVCDENGVPIGMIGTAQDVTRRKHQEEFRDRFIANAAHELRTPLTALLGFTEILANRRDRMSPEQVEAALQVANRSGARLSVLVNNLLDLSKLQQGVTQFELEPVSIAEVAREAVELTPPPEGKSVSVEVVDDAVAVADPHRLHQVFANLLTNAYRYGGDKVEIQAQTRDGRVEVAVVDNGPGVEPSLAPNLFEPFSRGDAAAAAGGSGLGLAIVKLLVEACGGQIRYEPARPNGTRFCIELERAA